MTLTSYETQVLRLLAASAEPVGTFEVADRLQSRPAPDIDAPDEDPVRAAWTEERIDLVQSTIALCAKGLADAAVRADGDTGDRFVATDAGRAYLARQ
ncbi:hypothetical protein ACWCYZ_34485 [Streptomyces virginiae]